SGDEDAAGIGRAQIAAAVEHEHLARTDRFNRLSLGVIRVAENVDAVEILPRRDAAQRDRLADKAAGVWVERKETIQERVAEAGVEELRRDRGGAGAGKESKCFG